MAMIDPLETATTLNEVLDRRTGLSGEQTWLTVYSKDRVKYRMSFVDLMEGAIAWAAHLADKDVKTGDRVLLVLPTGKAFYQSYWGILLSGAVPVPAYPPARLGKMRDYLEALSKLIVNCGARIMVTSLQVRPLLRPVQQNLNAGFRFVVPEEVDPVVPFSPVKVSHKDLALLQYTSGSTGRQKGVMLSHSNLLSNIRAIGKWIRFTQDDIAVSWLPLYHDMGLIGLMICTFYWGVPVIVTSPIDFLRRPVRWLRILSDHKGSVSAAPNFAYSLVARKCRASDLEGIDLSSWRLALCGAEPIFKSTIDKFTKRFESYGFNAKAFFPAYGLAENSLAVSFSDLNREPRITYVDAKILETEERAVPAPPGTGARALVSVGRPLDSVEIRVVDNHNNPIGEGKLGNVMVRGPSVMAGYFNNQEATKQVLGSGWLDTGDFGFILEGYLYISGRKKDMVIKAGRNYFAEDLEAAASIVESVRGGGICVFSVENPDRGTEDIVLVVEISKGAGRDGIVEILKTKIFEAAGCRPDHVILVPPRTLPKTSSGKLQRFKTRKWYLDGTLLSRTQKRRGDGGLWIYFKAWLSDRLRWRWK